MTKKRCTDCKYTKGIGFDFWCGEGHTKYEVFIGETDCPYFEYHDWSKGIPSKTEKRFTLDFDDLRAVWIDDNIDTKSYTVINDTLKKKNIQEIVDCLNELHEENEQLKKSVKRQQSSNNECSKLIKEQQKENEELKKLLDCSRKEAIEYCEELMGKDEFIRLYKRQRNEFIEENKQLKKEKDYYKRELQKELVCQAIIDERKNND